MPSESSGIGNDPREIAESAAWVPRRFEIALAVVTVIGLLARIIFAVHWTFGAQLHGDPLFFQQAAANIASGKGYGTAFLGKGAFIPTAEHPPFFPFVLSVLDIVGIRSVNAHRIAVGLLSAGGIVAMGLLGRRVAGGAVGLVAASIAALSPLWVEQGSFLMSESVYLTIVPIMLLSAILCLDRPTTWRFGVLGVTIAVAALTRSEALDFVVLLGGPVVVLSVRRWRVRLISGLALLVGLAVILVPWVVRNDLSLGALTFSTNGGYTLSGSYCTATFSPKSPTYGGFANDCQFGAAAVFLKYVEPPNHARHWTELALSNAMGHAATSYARQHLSDLPGVILAREGRVWGVYSPGTELTFDTTEDLNGARTPKEAGQILEWILLPLAAAGAVSLWRLSRARFVVIMAPVLVVALNAAAFYGSTRLRTAAEPSIAILAALGLVVLVRYVSARRAAH